MGILDEAIREHLELKRQHGAAEDELKRLEDEAFGPPERPGEFGGPDLFAEAPTEFMAPPEAAEEGPGEAEGVPATEPQASGSSTEERHAIAEQPTELYDVEGEIAASGPPAQREDQPPGGPAASSEPPPPDEDEPFAEPPAESEGQPAVEDRVEEPAGEVEEATGEAEEAAGEVDEGDDDFFDERRLSDELDQALDAPLENAEEDEPVEDDDAFAGEPPGVEADADGVEEAPPTVSDDAEAVGEDAEDDGEEERGHTAGARGHEDLLEDTPAFLEDAPEDDRLWFEQKPPSDFDFDD